jgi:hypothetical protein
VTVLEWKDRPTIELREEYRPVEAPPTLLGDFWASDVYAVAEEKKERLERLERWYREPELGKPQSA